MDSIERLGAEPRLHIGGQSFTLANPMKRSRLPMRPITGLAAYVYGGELGTCLALAERLEFGMIAVNRGLLADPAAPFGGMKESGLGREGAHLGILEFLESQYLAVEW